jgi:phenylpropionate dioxygenase-like ring-hydroxylating dioxygenase large terminal subunit
MVVDIHDLISQRQAGFSLPQAFYNDAHVYHQELEHVFTKLWMLAGHARQISETGDYFLTDTAGESICIVRQDDGKIAAFYNVCRHRGSRICLEPGGNTRLFVCPYHAWSYKLDGSLQSARLMPEDFNKDAMGLHPCHVREFEGLIFICLASGSPPDFDTALEKIRPFVAPQDLVSAKVIHEEIISTKANWKLVVENFWECYHCQPSHPEFMSVHGEDWVLAMGAGYGSTVSEDAIAGYEKVYNAFEERAAKLGHPLGSFSNIGTAVSDFYQVLRSPLGKNCYSETEEGKKVAPLMGDLKDFDGGMTHVNFNPLVSLWLCNDHAVSFNFRPTGPQSTDVHIMWLVDGEADVEKDIDVDAVSWMWIRTGLEDKTITENNQAGVNSMRYEPGPYSMMERQLEDFVQWYFARLQEDNVALANSLKTTDI